MKYGLIVALFIVLMLTGAFKSVQTVKADFVEVEHLIQGK